MARRWLPFFVLFFAEIWLAHAVSFFVHEYAHSFTAWAGGFKTDPLVLHFGDLSFLNLLFMSKIEENVDYGPVFGSGHGLYAALIAAAGVLSNAVLYVLSLLAYNASRGRRKDVTLFFYLLCVMCAGNFIDYVPTRTFSPRQDMSIVEKGLNTSPWMVVLFLGFPFLIGMLHLFLKLLPDARKQLFPADRCRQALLVIVSAFLVFVFFGAAGLELGSGLISNRLSLFFIFMAFPLVTIALWPRKMESAGDCESGDA